MSQGTSLRLSAAPLVANLLQGPLLITRHSERTDPASGEIQKYRQPHFIAPADRQPVCFAGLMSIWYPSPVAQGAGVTIPEARRISGSD